jgi:holo-[acyl-carrier protein] synthase
LPDEALGIGIDLVTLPRFADFLSRPEGDLSAVFTPAELRAAESDGRHDLYLATRWALKEAALKALGTGWSKGIEWTDVEVSGNLLAPRFMLKGKVREIAEGIGAGRILGSAAYAGCLVVAVAALERGAGSVGNGGSDALLPR